MSSTGSPSGPLPVGGRLEGPPELLWDAHAGVRQPSRTISFHGRVVLRSGRTAEDNPGGQHDALVYALEVCPKGVSRLPEVSTVPSEARGGENKHEFKTTRSENEGGLSCRLDRKTKVMPGARHA